MESSVSRGIKSYKIVTRDYASSVWFTFSAAMVFISLVGIFGSATGDLTIVGVIGGLIVSVLMLALPIWLFRRRYNFVKSTLEEGRITDGVVVKVRGLGSPKRVTYAYTVGGETIQTRNAIIVYGFRSPKRKGHEVQVVYNPSNPTEAFILSLYS